jgi:hypothetical protein
MIELFAGIQAKLTADATLVALLGGTSRIGQWGSPAAAAAPCVAYYLSSAADVPIDQAVGNQAPQDMTVTFVCVAKDGDSATYGGQTLALQITQQIKATLNGADLTATGLTDYAALYDNYISPPEFDEPSGEWRIDIRLRFIAQAD